MTRSRVKDKIIKENLIDYKCSICGISDWNNQYISLHLDHINGINDDHRLENLRFLCPNCHSQTETYAGRNNKTRYSVANKKVSDDDLILAMKKTSHAAHALELVGLSGAANYFRVHKLALKNDLYDHMSIDDKIKIRKSKLDSANLDRTKFGWIQKASEILKLTPQATGRWIRKNYPDYYQ